MSATGDLTRRELLYGVGIAAGATVLAACSDSDGEGGSTGANGDEESVGQGSEADPLPPPGQFGEAPMLAELVEAGELPPVEERVPETPYVVPHRWMRIGNYGGTLQMVTNTSEEWSLKEYQYGHSPLRWLNDGLDIGPGLAESWESNDDASVWTLHFRAGLKWSDGEPFTTADVLFWWEDMVLDDEFGEGVPDEGRSGTGTLAELSAPDDHTLVMTFDAPSPMVPEMIANWTGRGNGGAWVEPRHYLEQFHAKYNPDVAEDWVELLDRHRNPIYDAESPVLTGWMPEVIEEGRQVVWTRNPYYWAVDQEGNQLPYIDQIIFTVADNVETRKLQIQDGNYDFVHGTFHGLTLDDVAGIRRGQPDNGLELIMWDSGSGTGSVCFLNQDYDDPAMRELIRTPQFRQALSLAYDRESVRNVVYFETGDLTTGAYGPKTREFNRGDGEQVYEQWRDSWVAYEPERAKQMLDELGVVDNDGDGWRELPDGGRLRLRLDYPADSDPNGEHMKKNELLKTGWEEIGVETVINPIPPASFDDQWAQGQLMTNTAWEVSTVNVACDMLWLMPMEPSRWAPLQGQFYAVRGTPDEEAQLDVDPYQRNPPRMEPEPDGPIERLWQLSDQALVEPDELKRDELIYEMIKIHIEDGPFFFGAVANYPQIELVKNGLRNVPLQEETALGGLVNDWHHPTPAVYDPEAWYWDDPEAHA